MKGGRQFYKIKLLNVAKPGNCKITKITQKKKKQLTIKSFKRLKRKNNKDKRLWGLFLALEFLFAKNLTRKHGKIIFILVEEKFRNKK